MTFLFTGATELMTIMPLQTPMITKSRCVNRLFSENVRDLDVSVETQPPNHGYRPNRTLGEQRDEFGEGVLEPLPRCAALGAGDEY